MVSHPLLADRRIPVSSAEVYECRLRRTDSRTPHLWDLLDAVKDPEIPVVSIWELGILQDIRQYNQGLVVVTITPTYSGCPAMDTITEDIIKILNHAGYPEVEVNKSLSPAWSSNWILPSARAALKAFGIAPSAEDPHTDQIDCPQCESANVRLISEFGSTACKALYRCLDCGEPFDYFKRI